MALLAASSAMTLRTPSVRFTTPRHHFSGRSSRNRSYIVSASLGFTTDPRIQIERVADGLLKDVAALLVYQEVFRSPPAQAFLKLLLVLRRRDDDIKILEAYGEFFRLMATGKHSSWQDFLLEGILKADGNPFAEAAASSGDSSSTYGGRIPASLEAAATADLESLQRLSLNESTMISWVTELVSETKPQWRNAASSSLDSRTVPKVDEKKTNNIVGFLVTDEEKEASVEDKILVSPSEEKTIKTESDFVISERQQWQKKISGLWNWSEAVHLLKDYHAENGFGRVALSQVLKLRGGKLVPDFRYLKPVSEPHLTVWSRQQAALRENIHRHVSQGSAHHVFVHGPSGSGKSWLVKATLSKLSEDARFRVVLLPSSEFKQLATILEEMRKNSHIRFVLLVEDLFLRSVEESFVLLKAALDEHLQEWPRNVLLCATSSRSDAKIGETTVKLGDLFGLTVCLAKLNEQQYRDCVEELLEQSGDANNAAKRDEIFRQAIKFGEQEGFTARSASKLININN
ncbi:uncharacterized protein LOC9630360 [Selaginella moellendorffii]|uniref:uncharacterized protein LOC9630360 n=1 Tax=Selaginella moellendorffii TaxID=88036 RepID=UPI000D1CB06F|nr:uncharacterized protein LOC9630360 [Selaginella moellendorffii]|eukprot:XP_024519571.1 uncharacterized protein LOC9630360 [Selaginella moellendorffii]